MVLSQISQSVNEHKKRNNEKKKKKIKQVNQSMYINNICVFVLCFVCAMSIECIFLVKDIYATVIGI